MQTSCAFVLQLFDLFVMGIIAQCLYFTCNQQQQKSEVQCKSKYILKCRLFHSLLFLFVSAAVSGPGFSQKRQYCDGLSLNWNVKSIFNYSFFFTGKSISLHFLIRLVFRACFGGNRSHHLIVKKSNKGFCLLNHLAITTIQAR